jgi:HSP20 family molecular chaperone IbpA
MFFAPAIRPDRSLASLAPDLGFERWMGDTLRGFGGVSLEEDDKSWTLSLDVPGVAKEHLNVTVLGNSVRVESGADAQRQYKFFYELPAAVDADATEATLKDGVLTLRLSKAEVKDRRQIQIRDGGEPWTS